MIKTITREKAEELDMQIWAGDDEGVEYARMQHGTNREHKLYGNVFLIKK